MIQDYRSLQLVFRLFLIANIAISLVSCNEHIEVFESECNRKQLYIKVGLNELLEDIDKYDGRLVEVNGTYVLDFEESAIYSNSFFSLKSPKNGLWVLFDDFNIKCPLISRDSKERLFVNSSFKKKKMLLHGRVDKMNKGHLALYKGGLIDITLVEIR